MGLSRSLPPSLHWEMEVGEHGSHFREPVEGKGCSSVVEYLSSTGKARDNPQHGGEKEKKAKGRKGRRERRKERKERKKASPRFSRCLPWPAPAWEVENYGLLILGLLPLLLL
jgi:hypothetical protein